MFYAIPIRTHLDDIVTSTIKTAVSVTNSPVTTVTTTTTSTNTINFGKRLSPLILRPRM